MGPASSAAPTAVRSLVEGTREQGCPWHVRGGGEEQHASDASEVPGREDIRHGDVRTSDAACEGRRGNRHRRRDDGTGLVARRWPLPDLAPRLTSVRRPRRRRGACAPRAPGQLRHDARPELCARRERMADRRCVERACNARRNCTPSRPRRPVQAERALSRWWAWAYLWGDPQAGRMTR
jgi:hypothetical protein